MMNPHKITAEFEKALCEYTGAPYAVAVDNCSNALFLALYYELHVKHQQNPHASKPIITIPKHTYMSVPNEIIHAGGKVEFMDNDFYNALQGIDNPKGTLTGAYQLSPTNVWDSALSFTSNMYKPGSHMCLSFTGPYKHLKLGKGGAILTDDTKAYYWFRRARFSSRHECSYHDDNFDSWVPGLTPVVGWNFYMMPEIAARGLLLMAQFYNRGGTPKHNEDLCLPYPDLSKFKLWQ
jgi:dTDP-4-amino-4,6-dideoxygalactose transaminase